MGCSRAPFIGSWWRVEAVGREDGGGRWWVITSSVFNIETKGEELTGRPIEEGEMEAMGAALWFSFSDLMEGGASGEAVAIPSNQGGRKAPGGSVMGRRENFHGKIKLGRQGFWAKLKN
jgi:hypothetical protein